MTTKRTKRTWGQGTIEQRSPDTWVIRLSDRIDPATRKRCREARTIRGSKRDAERELRKMLDAKATTKLTPTTAGRRTLDAWVRQHLAGAVLSPRTRADNLRLWATYSTCSAALDPAARRDHGDARRLRGRAGHAGERAHRQGARAEDRRPRLQRHPGPRSMARSASGCSP